MTFKKSKKVNDQKLWDAYSVYIRLRDADSNGNCSCFTCGYTNHWKKMDCGHGISRRHLATKYDDRNNHAQCGRCNGFEGGVRETYKERVDKKYGAGTWDLLLVKSRSTVKRLSEFEINTMAGYYRRLADKIRVEKKIL